MFSMSIPAPTSSDTKSEFTVKDNLLLTSSIAGFGGILPSLCKLASASATSPHVHVIALGHIVALAMYFVISAILCFGMNERRRKEAFILGIAAPAIIASFASGMHQKPNTAAPSEGTFNFSFISSAYAGEEPKGKDATESGFWQDFKRGIGFQVETGSLQESISELESEYDILRNRHELAIDQMTIIEFEKDSLASEIRQYKLYDDQISNITKTCESLLDENSSDSPTSLKCAVCPKCSEGSSLPLIIDEGAIKWETYQNYRKYTWEKANRSEAKKPTLYSNVVTHSGLIDVHSLGAISSRSLNTITVTDIPDCLNFVREVMALLKIQREAKLIGNEFEATIATEQLRIALKIGGTCLEHHRYRSKLPIGDIREAIADHYNSYDYYQN